MHALIKSKINALDVFLNDLNTLLSPDYSLILSLQKQKNDPATRRTINIAIDRFKTKAKDQCRNYQRALENIIFLDQNLLHNCKTVLCLEKISRDYKRWYKKSARLNRKLDIKVTVIPKFSGYEFNKENEIKGLDRNVDGLGRMLPVAITEEEYQDYLRKKEGK